MYLIPSVSLFACRLVCGNLVGYLAVLDEAWLSLLLVCCLACFVILFKDLT